MGTGGALGVTRRYQLEQPAAQDAASQHQWGSVQRQLQRLATDVEGYSPGSAASWDPAAGPPRTLQEALDRIAARLASSGLGP